MTPPICELLPSGVLLHMLLPNSSGSSQTLAARGPPAGCCNVDGSANTSDVDLVLGEAHAQGPQGGRAVPPTATINAEPQSGVPIHGICFIITVCISHHLVTADTTSCCCAHSSLFLRLEVCPPWRLSHASCVPPWHWQLPPSLPQPLNVVRMPQALLHVQATRPAMFSKMPMA